MNLDQGKDTVVQHSSKGVSGNRLHKDRLFRLLFSEKEALLQLYNALNQTAYTKEEDLEITTLNDVVYLSMKNDISFIVGDNLQLYEHQSTYNPNMTLRGFFYLSALYKKIVDNKRLYGSKLVKIPTPKYIVFYNGKRKQKMMNCLSYLMLLYQSRKRQHWN